MPIFRAVLALVLIFLSHAATACSCSKVAGSVRYAEASTIIRGKVISTALEDNPGLSPEFGKNIVRATVRPIEILKGANAETFKVLGGSDYSNPVCTMALVTGAEYVFALGDEMVASACNSWLSDAPEIQEPLKTFRRLKHQSK